MAEKMEGVVANTATDNGGVTKPIDPKYGVPIETYVFLNSTLSSSSR